MTQLCGNFVNFPFSRGTFNPSVLMVIEPRVALLNGFSDHFQTTLESMVSDGVFYFFWTRISVLWYLSFALKYMKVSEGTYK